MTETSYNFNEILNFRDVGAFVNLIASKQIILENKILRGGKIEFTEEAAAVSLTYPPTIINLRNSKDPNIPGVKNFHFPISKNLDKYNTADRNVRRWLNRVLATLSLSTTCYPILVHCNSGKDRTGVVIASLLKILDIPNEIIIDEYFLSDGHINRDWIKHSLEMIGNPKDYFDQVDFENIFKAFSPPN
ncbi:tyrosine-protein phosphatase [Pseudomonas sp.]|uniref:tyrosine-protein phosphatase n=1 Tax=Pseudomonas sp. TaxID=306 RepID=UPI00289D1A59|nr:tyrosine-protein phosphatase [Pseudomonas sp.]